MTNSAGTTTTTTSFASFDEDEELRKLTMKQLGRLLKSYGMTQKAVNGVTRRAERVQVIRDFATQAEQEAAAVQRQREEQQQHPVLRHQGNNNHKKNKHGATIYW
eukprot:CAMPEP_0170789830 /NCGR_PEP_ID=MMETSP0733-20121128/19993_1 /TAXON_ID=186038 /ORGANISM="Fragilariopsis kerguelensis, Strain L26-C5" /LENGTH=104 /DNA_ID=CAMNT_0011137065 /DNA_START=43 /DNA_END=354 /DNA_ORIENTATION=+